VKRGRREAAKELEKRQASRVGENQEIMDFKNPEKKVSGEEVVSCAAHC
jgi:hypothetical protein